MDEQNVQQQVAQDQAPPTPPHTAEKLLTFTQEQMNALMSREKHEGKDSVYRALGLDPKDKAALEQAKAKLTAQQTITQPVSDKQEQQTKQQAQPEPPPQATQTQANTVVKAEAKLALLGAGVQPDLLEDALTLVLHKVEKSEDIQAQVDTLKTKHSVLFAPQRQTTGQLVGGVGTGAQPQGNPAAEFGKQLAQQHKQRLAGLQNQNYFTGGIKR